MLPSFRLIAATFLCGFVVVFAGLRMAASLNDMHEGLPVMAAHAASVSVAPTADSDARRGLTTTPVMYDLRFAVSSASPTVDRIVPTVFDRPAPALSIAPPQDFGGQDLAEPAKETPEPESTVAAIEPTAPVSAAADAPASLDALAEPPKPRAPAIASVEPQATPDLEPSTAEALIPEPDTTASVGAPDQSAAVPLPVARPAPKAVAKIANKNRVRTAQRAAPANNSPSINPASSRSHAQQQ